jgi:hypothetical protein
VKEICPVGGMLTHADRWSNEQMDMTHETGPFSDYANMTKNMVKNSDNKNWARRHKFEKWQIFNSYKILTKFLIWVIKFHIVV